MVYDFNNAASKYEPEMREELADRLEGLTNQLRSCELSYMDGEKALSFVTNGILEAAVAKHQANTTNNNNIENNERLKDFLSERIKEDYENIHSRLESQNYDEEMPPCQFDKPDKNNTNDNNEDYYNNLADNMEEQEKADDKHTKKYIQFNIVKCNNLTSRLYTIARKVAIIDGISNMIISSSDPTRIMNILKQCVYDIKDNLTSDVSECLSNNTNNNLVDSCDEIIKWFNALENCKVSNELIVLIAEYFLSMLDGEILGGHNTLLGKFYFKYNVDTKKLIIAR